MKTLNTKMQAAPVGSDGGLRSHPDFGLHASREGSMAGARTMQPWDYFPGRTMLSQAAAPSPPLRAACPDNQAARTVIGIAPGVCPDAAGFLTRHRPPVSRSVPPRSSASPGRAGTVNPSSYSRLPSPDSCLLTPVSSRAAARVARSSTPVSRLPSPDSRAAAPSSYSRLPSPDSCLLSPVSSRAAARAFTLIELLVVISIIAILMSILLPALAHFRTEGYITSSTEELTSVKAACLAYYAHFDAYPGLFSEADISNGDVKDSNGHLITGTQNMLISAMGTAYTSGTLPSGTAYLAVKDTISGSTFDVTTTLGTGPIDYANGSQQLNAFLTPAQAVLATQPPTPGTATPTALPTLYDEFPSGVPVLYWRRNAGSAANYPVGTNASTTANADFWLDCNAPYFNTTTLSAINGIVYDEQTTTSPHYSSYNDPTNGINALAAMVINQTTAPNYATAPNTLGYPVQGDFVLESAGPDHAYGPAIPPTGSTTTNWGTAAGQCDDIFVFGGQ